MLIDVNNNLKTFLSILFILDSTELKILELNKFLFSFWGYSYYLLFHIFLHLNYLRQKQIIIKLSPMRIFTR